MGIGKTLIGSVIGAAVALGVYYGIKQSTGETYVWFPLITGLVVGVGARMASGSSLSAGSRVVAGAVAAVIAGLAMFGPDVVEGMTGNAEFGPIESQTERLVNSTIAKSTNGDEGSETSQGDDESGDETSGSDSEDAGSGDDAGSSDEGSEGDSDTQDDPPADDEGSEESTDGDGESGDATAGNEESNGSRAQPNIDVNQAFAERGKPKEDVPQSPETIKKFEELIKKQKHESWLATFLPIICSGVGMVLAYIVGQSGAAPAGPKS